MSDLYKLDVELKQQIRQALHTAGFVYLGSECDIPPWLDNMYRDMTNAVENVLIEKLTGEKNG